MALMIAPLRDPSPRPAASVVGAPLSWRPLAAGAATAWIGPAAFNAYLIHRLQPVPALFGGPPLIRDPFEFCAVFGVLPALLIGVPLWLALRRETAADSLIRILAIVLSIPFGVGLLGAFPAWMSPLRIPPPEWGFDERGALLLCVGIGFVAKQTFEVAADLANSRQAKT